jgi:hypothetical protein
MQKVIERIRVSTENHCARIPALRSVNGFPAPAIDRVYSLQLSSASRSISITNSLQDWRKANRRRGAVGVLIVQRIGGRAYHLERKQAVTPDLPARRTSSWFFGGSRKQSSRTLKDEFPGGTVIRANPSARDPTRLSPR